MIDAGVSKGKRYAASVLDKQIKHSLTSRWRRGRNYLVTENSRSLQIAVTISSRCVGQPTRITARRVSVHPSNVRVS